MSVPKPPNEEQRLAALRAFHVLDSAPEVAYDEISELAAQICGCPVAYINFVEDDRRWLKARYGLPAGVPDEASRATAVCSTTICGTEVLQVPDLQEDPRFRQSPMLVGEPHCRFYCGMPLITDEGHALGTLCVMDFQPRQLDFGQIEALRRLSHQVLTQLELRRKLIEHDEIIRELDQARHEAATEKARTEELLVNMLPVPVVDELRKNGKVRPKYTRSATILFADFAGFTLLAEQADPATLVGLLDQYFTAFDDIVVRNRLEKLKTIGDAYMAVSGVPVANRQHATNACLAALEMLAVTGRMKVLNEKMRLPVPDLRIGINAGPVISGIVGKRQFAFDIWGDAVNTAALMEASGAPGRINVSETVAGHVEPFFELESRGPIEAKHERVHQMYFLNRLKPKFSHDADGHIANDDLNAICERSRTPLGRGETFGRHEAVGQMR